MYTSTSTAQLCRFVCTLIECHLSSESSTLLDDVGNIEEDTMIVSSKKDIKIAVEIAVRELLLSGHALDSIQSIYAALVQD